jgi:SAM-dependent methyltransferase
MEERAVGVLGGARRPSGPIASATITETARAFDGVAATYHGSNAENRILRAMRARAMAAIETCVPAGARLLDLGCGPGTDAEWLAARGYRITAVDASPAMVAEARRRVEAAGLEARVDVIRLGIHEVDRLAPATFDAAYSNFGPLNCVADPAAAARLVAARLRPGAALVATVIGRVCPWEMLLYLSRGAWDRAFLRYARAAVPVPLEGRTVWTRYFSPREFVRLFEAAGFRRAQVRALGLVTPPPYLQAFADRHPRLVDGLLRVEDVVAGWPAVRECGDHFLVVLRKA